MRMRKGVWALSVFFALGLWLSPAAADEGLWCLGMRMQGQVDFEPGNDYLIGPEIGYSNYNLAAHQLQFRAAYLTSRLEQAFRPNIYIQDYFLFSPLWHFRRSALFDPTVHTDLGYMRYSTEFAVFEGELDNNSWIATVNFGLGINLGGGRWGGNWHLGYNLIMKESSLVYPVIFGVGLWMML